MTKNYLMVNLNLFDGEGAGDGATGDSGSALAAGEQTGEVEGNAAGSEEETQVTTEDRAKAYKDFVNSKDYKDIHTKEIQKIIDRRFAQSKNLEAEVESYRKMMGVLSERYGADNPEGIMKAIENDDSFWQEKAYEAGMDVDHYKEMQSLKRKNAELREMQEAQRRHEEGMRKLAQWREEEAKIKEIYPDFDADAEAEMNPDFKDMLRLGVPMQKAYEVSHFDEIKENLAQVSAQRTAKAVTDNIRAKGNRPVENGTSSQGAISVKSNVENLTNKEIDELIKRAERGEIISL